MPTDPAQVTVVLPTFNERENLEPIVRAVTRHGYRVLVVDDNSPDGTGELADHLATEIPSVGVLHRPHKAGLGPAYAAGFHLAFSEGARIICEMDADFSHDPAALPSLVDAVDRGAALAIGSRYVEGGATPDWPLHRRLLSKGGNWYARIMLGLPVRDATAGFRAYRALALMQLESETCLACGYAFQVELTLRAVDQGLRIVEVPITFGDRREGTSKMGARIVAEAMWLITKWGVRRRIAGK
ncbi:MAG: glycosyltransferase [Gammaproteobacteria bacterium]|nr:glycosyltransferase [Gammaproteobacteria bacterium]